MALQRSPCALEGKESPDYVKERLDDPEAVLAIDETSGSRKKARNRWEFRRSTREWQARRPIARSGCSRPMLAHSERCWWTGNCTCPRNGRKTRSDAQAGVPEQVTFQTRQQLAECMIERFRASQLPVS